MKKIAMTAIAVAAVLGAGAANAYTSGTFQNGFVVPNVYKDGPTKSTTVGIVSKTAGPVYWTFFDQDSNHKYDGCFVVTANDYTPFVWTGESPANFDKQRGYLVFATGTTGSTCAAGNTLSTNGQIAGHAFYVDVSTSDVAFTPVIDGPLFGTGDLTRWGPASLTSVGGAAPVPQVLNMRYYTAGGSTTAITVWSTGSQKGDWTVNVYDDKQDRRSTQMELLHDELDVVVLDSSGADAIARPASFVDGFVELDTTQMASLSAGSIFSYSTIDAPAFGALQTILGFHQAAAPVTPPVTP